MADVAALVGKVRPMFKVVQEEQPAKTTGQLGGIGRGVSERGELRPAGGRGRRARLLPVAAASSGSTLTRRLLADGADVIGIDNLCTGSLDNLSDLDAHAGFRFVRADASEPIDHVPSVTHVFHLTSPVSPPDYLRLSIETMRVGSAGTFNDLDLARRSDARLVLASTSESHGDAEVHPQAETYWGNVNPVGPRAVYDEAEWFSEALVSAYRREFQTNTVIARTFNTYEPRMRR